MINGLGIVGWGVGGIEAEAGMLGQPVYFLTPDVVGVHLTGALARRRHGDRPGADGHADAAQGEGRRQICGILRPRRGGAAGGGPRDHRATWRPNTARPWASFPIDAECVELSARHRPQRGALQALRKLLPGAGTVRHSEEGRHRLLAGSGTGPGHGRAERGRAETPAGPHRIAEAEAGIYQAFSKPVTENGFGKTAEDLGRAFPVGDDGSPATAAAARNRFRANGPSAEHQSADRIGNGQQPSDAGSRCTSTGAAPNGEIHHGSVLIAAITSCTNTSNPVRHAGRRTAGEKSGRSAACSVNPLVKSSLAPGSRVVSDYLNKTGLQPYLDQLGFNLVGYGCTTCIGNSGPLHRADRGGRDQRTIWSPRRCFPATAISRRASTRTSRRISSCRRRWSSRSRWPAAWTLT